MPILSLEIVLNYANAATIPTNDVYSDANNITAHHSLAAIAQYAADIGKMRQMNILMCVRLC